MNSSEYTKKHLEELTKELLEGTQHVLQLNRDSIRNMLSTNGITSGEPGVYVLIKDKKLIYVGETGDLYGRLLDLTNTMNHSFRQKYGKSLFPQETASSKQKFPAEYELKLDQHIEKNISIAFLMVWLGRKELEESIQKNHNPPFNKRGKRGK